MIQVLLVDDDEIIRQGMVRSIDWDRHQIAIAGVARNGEEGLEMAVQLRPQVVVSDIRMPYMDGLEMTRRIHEVLPDVKVVLLTGYDDFQYAQKAISLRVSAYVLKFAGPEEIVDAVLKAAGEGAVEKRSQAMLLRSRRLLTSEFFGRLSGGLIREEEICGEAESLGIHFEGSGACVALVGLPRQRQSNDPLSLEALQEAAIALCEDETAGMRGIWIYAPGEDTLCVVFSLKGNPRTEKAFVTDILERIALRIREATGAEVRVGVSHILTSLAGVQEGLGEARAALGLCEKAGNKTLLHISEVRHSTLSQFVMLRQILDFLDSNYDREELGLADIAAEVHITPKYVCTLFKKYHGSNISDYLIQIRIGKACELLKHTELKTYEIAQKVGYSNPQHFSVVFKKTTGFTPTEYRAGNRNENRRI